MNTVIHAILVEFKWQRRALKLLKRCVGGGQLLASQRFLTGQLMIIINSEDTKDNYKLLTLENEYS